MSAPRNVLFIVIDQWRADALGCAGNARIETPNLDRLAADGVLFRRHFVQASPCGPSRAALLTGTYQHTNGVVRNGAPLSRRFTNLALEARKAGYDPALFGYTDTAPDPTGLDPADPALRSYEGVMPGFTAELHLPERPLPWMAHLARRGYPFAGNVTEIYRPADNETGGETGGRGPTFAPARFAAEDSITAFLTDRLLDYIALHRDRPWFAHAAYIRPHPPFVAPRPYHALYRAEDMPRPVRAPTVETEASQHPLLATYLRSQAQSGFFVTGDGLVSALDDDAIAQLRATYYGMVREVDDQVGRLLDRLKDWGLYDDTLIVVTADHGEMLGDHWLLGKQGYFDEAFHVPLIVRDPGRAADAGRGRTVTRFTEAVDVMPTILDWLGRAAPRQCDGRSLLPFLRGEAPADWRREVHWEFDFRGLGTSDSERALGLPMDACSLAVIRDETGKYVHFAALPPLFFDLASDPHCLHDRAADPACAARLLDYAQRLLSWRLRSNERGFTGMTTSPGGLLVRS
ncbi:MAG: alkaline phosphatase family protein [Proteobacteria bacterium]|nr:alkaline phosphatase family protein [Pseudomonadota bacterium]